METFHYLYTFSVVYWTWNEMKFIIWTSSDILFYSSVGLLSQPFNFSNTYTDKKIEARMSL
jgi:hypothetical protein